MWFADIFVKMLLFHGLNVTSSASVPSSAHWQQSLSSTPSSASPSPTPQFADGPGPPLPLSSPMISHVASEDGTPVHTRGAVGSAGSAGYRKHLPSPSSSSAAVAAHLLRSNDAAKHRKLEERMGPGGAGLRVWDDGAVAAPAQPVPVHE